MSRNSIVKKRMEIRILLCICAALGWWGILYPELTMTPDTYRIVDETGSVQNTEEVLEWDFDSDIYWKVLNADRSQVRFKSRLLTGLNAFTDYRRGSNESGE